MLCERCQKTAKVAIENVATYHGELLSLGGRRDVERRRATGISDPTGTLVAAVETREADAGDVAAAETKAELVGWVRILVRDRPQVVYPRDTVEALAAVLVKRTATIATLDWAASYVADVLALEQRLRKIVQRSKGHWYAGVCMAELTPERAHDQTSCACGCHVEGGECDVEGGSCGPEYAVIAAEVCTRDLFALPGSTHVRCPVCRTNHPVQARRAVLLEEARDTKLPLMAIAQVCVSLLEGEPSVERLYQRIHKWTKRGTLPDYGVRVLADRRAHRVYRLGDVLDTLISEASKVKRGASC